MENREIVRIQKTPFNVQFIEPVITDRFYFQKNKIYVVTEVIYDRVKNVNMLKFLGIEDYLEFNPRNVIVYTAICPN